MIPQRRTMTLQLESALTRGMRGAWHVIRQLKLKLLWALALALVPSRCLVSLVNRTVQDTTKRPNDQGNASAFILWWGRYRSPSGRNARI